MDNNTTYCSFKIEKSLKTRITEVDCVIRTSPNSPNAIKVNIFSKIEEIIRSSRWH
uniref:Uncharacterized protein n=1 Tax=Lepeophtheirus salmonis TaxID=72036 RepID=A0A0K2U1Q0_LEPSM